MYFHNKKISKINCQQGKAVKFLLAPPVLHFFHSGAGPGVCHERKSTSVYYYLPN